MLRGCSFSYAGVSSKEYELELYYLDDNSDKFVSGSDYEIITDNIPMETEQILYGINHSTKPLEFDIEIFNPYRSITIEEMANIKQWLFGQQGWNRLYLDDDDFMDLYLNCILIPIEDVADVTGYRGLRCTVHNISPYWYGEEIITNFTINSSAPTLTINVQSQCPTAILPNISFVADNDTSALYIGRKIDVYNRTNGSQIHLDMISNNENFSDGSEWVYNGKYHYVYNESHDLILPYIASSLPEVPILYLDNGENEITMSLYKKTKTYDSITRFTSASISYVPMYRIGGF